MTKCFWDSLTSRLTIAPDTGRITIAIAVMSGEIVSIMMIVPMTVVTDEITIETLCVRLCTNVSTSFVILESTSPYGLLSKYFIGILFIFSAMSRRIL